MASGTSDGAGLEVDQRPVHRVLEGDLIEVLESGRAKVREDDPLGSQLLSVSHELLVRDVRRILTGPVRRLADEQVCARRNAARSRSTRSPRSGRREGA